MGVAFFQLNDNANYAYYKADFGSVTYSDRSWSAWVKNVSAADLITNYSRIIDMGFSTNFCLCRNASDPSDCCVFAGLIQSTGFTLSDGDWHCVLITINGTTGAGNVYVDGVLAATFTSFSGGITHGLVGIGGNVTNNANGDIFNGSIAHVAFWDSERTSGDAVDLQTKRPDQLANLPLHYWKLTRATGTISDLGTGTAMTLSLTQAGSGDVICDDDPLSPDNFNYLYSSLFSGLIGAWDPQGPLDNSNSPVGGFRDWSGNRNHARRANLTDSNYAIDSGRYYVNAPYPPVGQNAVTKQVSTSSGEISLSCWINLFWSLNGVYQLVIAWDYGGNNGIGLIISTGGTAVDWSIREPLGVGAGYNSGQFPRAVGNGYAALGWADQTWHHFNFRAKSSGAKIFLDGVDQTLSSTGGAVPSLTNLPINLISNPTTTDYTQGALVEELTIHDRYISDAEVGQMAAARGNMYTLAPTGSRRRRLICAGGA